ncbi:MAG: prepilin-type N-terminal cleavage/methylation domain-containing protein [Clostridia bacterium]|nr:prepilin-type N-terminal cleavage/methylation domain-containing protein [Clostridia bacterium]
MLYSFLRSKKGYTFVEVLIVVIVLGILTAVGVPVFTSGYKAQAKKDCNNQRVVVKSLVQEVMTGMIDNGRSQKFIDFAKVPEAHKTTYTGDGVTGNGDDSYVGESCFILVTDEDAAFTIGDVRGGYRDKTKPNCGDDTDGYKNGCEIYGNYLKKERLKDNKFFWYLTNEEIPVCPFADYENSETTDDYHYYIFNDGTVLCDCPDCNDIDD